MLIFQQRQEKPTNVARGMGQSVERQMMFDTSGWVGGSVCTAQHAAAALDSGFQSALGIFSSSSASPSAASSLRFNSGYNSELAQSTCCLLHMHSRLKIHRRYHKSASTRHDKPTTRNICRACYVAVLCVSVLQHGSHLDVFSHNFRLG